MSNMQTQRTRSGSSRDFRLDFFRGLALFCIFIDHVPGNSLGYVTLQAFGLSDAAEVFVLIAGYSAFMAYSGDLERKGLLEGAKRPLLRVRDLFASHLILVAVCGGGLTLCARYFENPLYFEHINLTPFAYDPLTTIANLLVLVYQPGYLNILPLYILLLAWFPVLWWLLKRNAAAALGLSAGMWLGARFGLNAPSWPEGTLWYFNPFAWQLLFTIGAFAASRTKAGGTLPRSPWLTGIAVAYVILSFVVMAPWVNIPDVEIARIIPTEWIPWMSKTKLSAWRLAHILALAYLVAVTVPAGAAWLRSRTAGVVVSCGRNSLDIFCLGTVLSFAGFVVMLEAGRSWPYQAAVNGIGIAILIGTALMLDRRKARAAGKGKIVPAAERAAAAPLPEAEPS